MAEYDTSKRYDNWKPKQLRYGRWTFIKKVKGRPPKYRSLWLCRCDCGTERVLRADGLYSGRSTSCGCYHREQWTKRMTKHSGARAPEYCVWTDMKQRCHNPRSQVYKYYGARGITVAPEWRSDFGRFIADMGSRPSPEHEIERRDNAKGYSPENCYWATRDTQMRNTRQNRWLTANGETLCITDWARRLGCKQDGIIRYRLQRGYSVEEAVTRPVKHPTR